MFEVRNRHDKAITNNPQIRRNTLMEQQDRLPFIGEKAPSFVLDWFMVLKKCPK